MKFYHRISDDEHKELVNKKLTWGDLVKQYKQPKWCGYNKALNGEMGCWSLVCDRKRINNKYCSDCEMYKLKDHIPDVGKKVGDEE